MKFESAAARTAVMEYGYDTEEAFVYTRMMEFFPYTLRLISLAWTGIVMEKVCKTYGLRMPTPKEPMSILDGDYVMPGSSAFDSYMQNSAGDGTRIPVVVKKEKDGYLWSVPVLGADLLFGAGATSWKFSNILGVNQILTNQVGSRYAMSGHKAEFYSEITKLLGEEFFDISKPYKKMVAVKDIASLVAYTQMATLESVSDWHEEGLYAYLLAGMDIDQALADYPQFLKTHFKGFLIQRRPFTRSDAEFEYEKEIDGKPQSVYAESLKEVRKFCPEREFEYIASTLAYSTTTVSGMLIMPTAVAEFVTQLPSNKIDVSHVGRYVIDRYENEVVAFGYVQTYCHTQVTMIKGLNATNKPKTPVKPGTDPKTGLGMTAYGVPIYIPNDMDTLEDYEAKQSSIAKNDPDNFYYQWDATDIPKNYAVINKTVQERPRPALPNLSNSILYVDWRNRVLCYTDRSGSLRVEEVGDYRPFNIKALRIWLEYPALALPNTLPTRQSNMVEHIYHILSTRLVKPLDQYFSQEDVRKYLSVPGVETPDWIADSFYNDIINACKSSTYARLGDIAIRMLERVIKTYESNDMEAPEALLGAYYDTQYAKNTKGITLRHISSESPIYICSALYEAISSAFKAWKTKFEQFTLARAVIPACTEFALMSIISRYSSKYGEIVTALSKTPKTLPNPPADYKPKPLAGIMSSYTSQPHQVRTDFHLNDLPPEREVILNVAAGGGKCVVGSTLIPSSLGLLSIEEQYNLASGVPIEGYKESVFNVVTTEGVKPTSHVYQTAGYTMKATMANGSSIEGLPEHKLLNWNDGDVDFVPLGETKTGDWIVRSGDTQIFGTKIDLPKHKYENCPTQLTKPLAELLGWIVSEGYIPVKPKLEIEQHDDDMRARISKLCADLFHVNPFLHEKSVRLCGEERDFLRSIVGGLGLSKDRCVPMCIRTAPKDIQAAFLQSLFEGDGTIYITNKGTTENPVYGGYVLEYSTTSSVLATQLQVLLENFGLTTTLTEGVTYTSKYAGETKAYSVYIPSSSHQLFESDIGFISDRKKTILSDSVAAYNALKEGSQDTNRFIFGLDNQLPCGDEIVRAFTRLYYVASSFQYTVATGRGFRSVAYTPRSLHKLLGVRITSLASANKDGVSTRWHATRLLNVLKVLPKVLADALRADEKFMSLFNKIKVAYSYKWVRVNRMESGGFNKVYDLVVPGPHNYAANTIMSHNTHLVWTDVARKIDSGLVKRPLVLCPGYLMKNYIEDGQYMFEGRFNVVCIDNTNVKAYKPSKGDDILGLDGIVDMVLSSPPNTLFVASYDFLYKAAMQGVVYGNIWVNHNPNVDALIECGFDYIMSDESHELRNIGSGKHREAAVLYAQCEWKGLASGTLLNTRPEDLPNQMKLVNPSVFGSTENFIEEYAATSSGGKVLSLRHGAKDEIVDAMRKNTRYIQVKRKEWAALLPKRKDQWHILSLPEGSIYRVLYDTVLQQVMALINELLQKNKEVAEAMKKSGAMGDGVDEDEWKITSLLDPYLQRLEKLLMAPHLDEDFTKIVGTAGIGVSPKILKAIQICEGHIFGKSIQDIETYNSKQDGSGLEIEMNDEIIESGGIKKQPGKIMILCSYQACVDAMYDALPDDLKRMAVNYKAGNKDKDLLEFTTNDSKRILIGIGTSLATGHNFQMCTRIIRLEAVWSPGELEQSESRINRPELKNANAERTSIYYDWIALNGTIDCSKLSRLTSRMLTNILIEEIDNPAYNDVEQLPLISMNLDAIREVAWVALPGSESYEKLGTRNLYNYIVELHKIREIQKAEYQEFRDSPLGNLPPSKVASKPMPDGSAFMIGIPPIPGQNYPNSRRLGLMRYAEYANTQDKGNLNAIEEFDCVGLTVATPEGVGEIKSHTTKSVLVAINGKSFRFDKLCVSVCTDPSVDSNVYVEAVGLDKVVYRGGKDISVMFQKSGKRSKPANVAPIKMLPTKVERPVPHVEEDEGGDGGINLYAQVYNGMLSVAIDLDDADLDDDGISTLEGLGFNYCPESYYIEVPNYKVFSTLLTKLEEKWEIAARTLKLLWQYEAYFEVGRSRLFNADAEITDVFDYYRTPLRKVPSGRLKPAFVVEGGVLYLMIDAENHVDAAKVARVKVPGATWDMQPGSLRAVFPSKKDASNVLRQVKKSFTILNEDDFKEDVKQIRL